MRRLAHQPSSVQSPPRPAGPAGRRHSAVCHVSTPRRQQQARREAPPLQYDEDEDYEDEYEFEEDTQPVPARKTGGRSGKQSPAAKAPAMAANPWPTVASGLATVGVSVGLLLPQAGGGWRAARWSIGEED